MFFYVNNDVIPMRLHDWSAVVCCSFVCLSCRSTNSTRVQHGQLVSDLLRGS